MNQPGNNREGIGSGAIRLEPVGTVRNQSREPSWGENFGALSWRERAARMQAQQETISELVIDERLEGILDGIEDFSHLDVLYWAHLVPVERRTATLKVHPIGNKEFPLVGIFATRSPIRPNSILVTTVCLLERRDNVLKVTGLDALDGSPILDIKPHSPDYQDHQEVRVPGWMREFRNKFS
jgi:tRNA-Thr(GGU) m(6)t(6)A37 methyltransferase TsaA